MIQKFLLKVGQFCDDIMLESSQFVCSVLVVLLNNIVQVPGLLELTARSEIAAMTYTGDNILIHKHAIHIRLVVRIKEVYCMQSIWWRCVVEHRIVLYTGYLV